MASVAIALIRPQAERTRPPRALWVPFELGRPIGPPNDPVFQKRVVRAALGLLSAEGGPVVLHDFPDDDPREADDPNWHAPPLPAAEATDPAALAEALTAELLALAPAYAWSCTARARSSVGLSGLAPAAIGATVAAWLRGEVPESPVADMSPALALRFAIDDLKAYALEAAIARGHPSSRQLGDWFWNDTVCGAAIRTLRERFLAGDDDSRKTVAAFFVPALRI